MRIKARYPNTASGYVELYLEDGTRIYEHRYVMQQVLGRALTSDEVVHHRDEDKANNSPENLEVMSQAEHARLHFSTGRTLMCLECVGCGCHFERERRQVEPKRATGQTDFFCGRRCFGIYNRKRQLQNT